MIGLEPDHEFLILASDGLWDKVIFFSNFFQNMFYFFWVATQNSLIQVDNQEAVDIARPLCVDVEKPQPLVACRKLADLSVSRGSADDISVMIIHLGKFC